jgi:hypothetical protein
LLFVSPERHCPLEKNNENNQDNEQKNSHSKYTDGGVADGNAIAARDIEDEMTMETATIACSLGVVAISKTNFMPGA